MLKLSVGDNILHTITIITHIILFQFNAIDQLWFLFLSRFLPLHNKSLRCVTKFDFSKTYNCASMASNWSKSSMVNYNAVNAVKKYYQSNMFLHMKIFPTVKLVFYVYCRVLRKWDWLIYKNRFVFSACGDWLNSRWLHMRSS